MLRTPTSTLLNRIETHIDRLDRVLRDCEELLDAIRHGDRADWITELQKRLDAHAAEAVSDASGLKGSIVRAGRA